MSICELDAACTFFMSPLFFMITFYFVCLSMHICVLFCTRSGRDPKAENPLPSTPDDICRLGITAEILSPPA